MNILFLLAYLAVCFLLLYILRRDELLEQMSERQQLIVRGAVFVVPAIFFAPYALNLVTAATPLPGWSWLAGLPFFLLAAASAIVQYFYPQKKKKLGPIFVALAFGIIILLNFMPLIWGLLRW